MTRAIDRLIISGADDPKSRRDGQTSIRWLLERLEIDLSGEEPAELERGGAHFLLRVDRRPPEEPQAAPEAALLQLELFAPGEEGSGPAAPALPALPPIPEPPGHRVRRLSYIALALFESCSYRFYAERIVGMRPSEQAGAAPRELGLAATEIGDAVHVLLELDTAAGELRDRALTRYPGATEDDLERVTALVRAWRGSALAAELAGLDGVRAELPFAFEHGGVLLHGRFDVFRLAGGRALVLDYKTNRLEEVPPAEVVEEEYALQRLVYALAAFRAGAEEVEVIYVFLEWPDEVVRTVFLRAELPAMEARLSEAIRAIQEGEFRPTPGEFACAGCPAHDVVCAGLRLPSSPPSPATELGVP
jgi:ATP-dependent exoDNAse (exonuclease V) beta subunit